MRRGKRNRKKGQKAGGNRRRKEANGILNEILCIQTHPSIPLTPPSPPTHLLLHFQWHHIHSPFPNILALPALFQLSYPTIFRLITLFLLVFYHRTFLPFCQCHSFLSYHNWCLPLALRLSSALSNLLVSSSTSLSSSFLYSLCCSSSHPSLHLQTAAIASSISDGFLSASGSESCYTNSIIKQLVSLDEWDWRDFSMQGVSGTERELGHDLNVHVHFCILLHISLCAYECVWVPLFVLPMGLIKQPMTQANNGAVTHPLTH